MDERSAKRDLVLSPSEYAYMQDVTKGVIKTYTGPTVINPTAQERPVKFSAKSKQFEQCTLEESVQQCAIAPEGFYVILKNPATNECHPDLGGVYPTPDINVGRKINITGPCMFPLWPGQLVQLVQGHHLRSNQYLLVRVYNEEEARKHWSKAVIKPAITEMGAEQETQAAVVSKIPKDLSVGKLYIIKGTDVSFYIPPTGVGVVVDENGKYVRDALTLERLEYCILVEQNGKKRYERGPQVVFPEPTEAFISRGTERKFRAVELNEIQGLHIKVIAPYEERGKQYKEGDEIFITGKETAIYFPREEHSLVRYDGKDKHFAVAVPAGEARYVMNRKTGEISMVRGPAMLLPNPVDEVIVRRMLSDRECEAWYPKNSEALAYNQSLRQVAARSPTTRAGAISEGDVTRAARHSPDKKMGNVAVSSLMSMDVSSVSRDVVAAVGDVLERGSSYTQPRTLVFNTKYEGVPGINVHVGYAVMVVNNQGSRCVEQGPKNLLLEYDESLEILSLSTGKPKSDHDLFRTAYLRVLNNKISDLCDVETLDHVQVRLSYSMRVNFTGEPNKWFEVENYVQFLCHHVRSVLKGVVKRRSVEDFYSNAAAVIRDAILGKLEEGDKRPGMLFVENGMHVLDVEVLGVQITDTGIASLLGQAQQEAIQSSIKLSRSNREAYVLEQQEAINRRHSEAKAETSKRQSELMLEDVKRALMFKEASYAAAVKEQENLLALRKAEVQVEEVKRLAILKDKEELAQLDQLICEEQQKLQIAAMRAEAETVVQRFQAAQNGFSEAILALSNKELLVKVAEAMSVQQFVGGKNLVDVVTKVFEGTPLKGILDQLSEKAAVQKILTS